MYCARKAFNFPAKRVNPKTGMAVFRFSFSFFLLLLTLPIFFTFIHATTFQIRNSCPYTVWAAAVPGGGKQLDQGQTWSLTVSSNKTQGHRIWGRTNCYFDDAGNGSCESGGCGGVLQCKTYGSPPNTLAEYSLNNDLDVFDISVVDGYNIPMEFGPTSEDCRRINCTGDINGACPNELRDPGGCNNPCTVFNNDQYCCLTSSCNATVYSRFFKDRCPDVYSYATDDATSMFSCPTGSDFRLVFCP